MKVAVIGSGFSGLAAAAYAAKAGHEVHVFEKHNQPGGRARQFRTDCGFAFDMGPSWYWMPDVMESFFHDFGRTSSDFYELKRLDPQFEIVFDEEVIAIPGTFEALRTLCEQIEPGCGPRFDKFMEAAEFKYHIGMGEFVRKPCRSWSEFMSFDLLKHAQKLDLLTNFRKYVAKYFSDPRLQTIMEFPVIFLGAAPQHIPALYSLMNYGGYALGTFYPMGGFYQLVLAMQKVAEEQGVQFHFNQEIEHINVQNREVRSISGPSTHHECDALVASGDYPHMEQLLEEAAFRNYKSSYWESRTFAPSCLIYYLGFDRKISNLKHHTLFFDAPFEAHLDAIYAEKSWPDEPLFYACCPSKSDPGVAPENGENLFLLMPIATGLRDSAERNEEYLDIMLARLEKHTGISGLKQHIVYKQSYSVGDFVRDYHAYGGNAYGLANTLRQTAVWKPKMHNKTLSNLLYTGQLTVPGPGVPPAIISGKIVAEQIDFIT